MNREKFTDIQKQEIIQKYETGEYSCGKLGKEYGFNQASINRFLRRSGVTIRGRTEISKDQSLEIINKYKTGEYSCLGLSKEYNVSPTPIRKILKENGIKVFYDVGKESQVYTINEDYFEVLDTKEKAYWLGLLYADGYNNEKQGKVKLVLEKKDKEILEKFNISLNHNKPLSLEIRDNETDPTKKHYFYNLLISRKRISKQLAKLGMFQRKSLTLKFPAFLVKNEQLLKSFILGYFDGDGSIYSAFTRNYQAFKATFTSSKFFCLYLRRILKRFVGVNCEMHKCITKSDQTYYLRINGNRQVYKLLSWLYKDEPLRLERKYNRFLELENKVLYNTNPIYWNKQNARLFC